MLNGSNNWTAVQGLKTNRSVKCRLGFIFLHMSKKTSLFFLKENVLQKKLCVALPANKLRREALSEPVNWQLLPESILRLVGWKFSACQKQSQNIGAPFLKTNELLFHAKKPHRNGTYASVLVF